MASFWVGSCFAEDRITVGLVFVLSDRDVFVSWEPFDWVLGQLALPVPDERVLLMAAVLSFSEVEFDLVARRIDKAVENRGVPQTVAVSKNAVASGAFSISVLSRVTDLLDRRQTEVQQRLQRTAENVDLAKKGLVDAEVANVKSLNQVFSRLSSI